MNVTGRGPWKPPPSAGRLLNLRRPDPVPDVRPVTARPVEDPDWPGFVLRVRAPGSGINPRLVDSDREFGVHGPCVWRMYKWGRDDERAALRRDVGSMI